MRSNRFSAMMMTCALGTVGTLGACAGEEPTAQAPPQPPPVTPSASPPATAPLAQVPTSTVPTPPKPTLAELIPQTLKGIGEAFNAHDAKALSRYYSEDCVIAGNGEPDAHGREDVAKSLQGLFDTFGDAKSAALRVWVKGNVVVSEIVWTGTMTADFMGMKATKKAVGQTRLHVLWFNDEGLVKEVHQYADSSGLTAQLEGKTGSPPLPTLPTNSPDVHSAKGTPDEEKLADWGKGIDEGLSEADPKAAVGLLADDADDWLNFGRMPPVKGKKELTKRLDAWLKAFPDQKWSAVNAWGIDGFAIVESTMRGAQKGRFGPLPPSNKPVTNWHWVNIWQPSAEGKVQHHWGYANPVEMMQQTGAIKPRAVPPPSTTRPATDKGGVPKG